jgi:hypothetical protein
VAKALLLGESFALRELRVAEQTEKSLKPGETLQFSAVADQ